MAHYTEKFREEIKDQLPNDSKIAERFLADMDANISDFMDEFGEDKVTYLILVKRYGSMFARSVERAGGTLSTENQRIGSDCEQFQTLSEEYLCCSSGCLRCMGS